MIESITTEVISSTRDGGRRWFHPRACTMPHAGGECLPSSGYQGETLLARVRWRRPHRLFA